MDFKKGDIHYILRGPGKPYKIHILATVEENMIVFRWYGRHKQWWHYEIQRSNLLEFEVEATKR